MKYVVTFPDGATATVKSGSVRLTHAVVDKADGRWVLADPGCMSKAMAAAHRIELELIANYADLQVVPLVAA
jgi:hypothetical protein